MKFDATVSFSLLIAIFALMSPVITSYLTKKYDLQLKLIELKKGTLTTSYSRTFDIFSNFTDSAYILMSVLYQAKKDLEFFDDIIEDFEKSTNQCLLILDESERKTYESFRIMLKTELGFEDPRPKYKSNLTVPLQFSTRINPFHTLEKEGDKVYIEFNKCLTIANKKLSSLEQEELSILTMKDTKTVFFRPINSSRIKSDKPSDKRTKQ